MKTTKYNELIHSCNTGQGSQSCYPTPTLRTIRSTERHRAKSPASPATILQLLQFGPLERNQIDALGAARFRLAAN